MKKMQIHKTMTRVGLQAQRAAFANRISVYFFLCQICTYRAGMKTRIWRAITVTLAERSWTRATVLLTYYYGLALSRALQLPQGLFARIVASPHHLARSD